MAIAEQPLPADAELADAIRTSIMEEKYGRASSQIEQLRPAHPALALRLHTARNKARQALALHRSHTEPADVARIVRGIPDDAVFNAIAASVNQPGLRRDETA